MKKKLNPIAFLSLVSLVAVLGISTENKGYYGFLGFLYYLRYFWVIPDEAFLQNIQKSCTIAFMSEMIALVPSLFVCSIIFRKERYIPISFGFAFSVAIFAFTITLAVLEYRESSGISND